MSLINYHYMHWVNHTERSEVQCLMDSQWDALRKPTPADSEEDLQMVCLENSLTSLEIETYQKEMEEKVDALSQQVLQAQSALVVSQQRYDEFKETHAEKVASIKQKIAEAKMRLAEKDRLISLGIEQSKNAIIGEISGRAISVQQASQAIATWANSAVAAEVQSGNARVAQESSNGSAKVNAEHQKLAAQKAALSHCKKVLSQAVAKGSECKNKLETGRYEIATMYDGEQYYVPLNKAILGREAEEAALQHAIQIRDLLNEAIKFV